MGCFVVMIVGMVDDRAMRFRQQAAAPLPRPRPAIRQPRPTPKPVAPEPTPPNPLEEMVNNYLRTSGQLANDQVKYGGQVGGLGSRTADLLVGQGGVPDSSLLRAGALVGDIALDPGWLVPGLGAAKGVSAAVPVVRGANALRGTGMKGLPAYATAAGNPQAAASALGKSAEEVISEGGPMQGALLRYLGRHRSSNPSLGRGLMHPEDVPIEAGRNFGPSTYFAQTPEISDSSFSGFGKNIYRVGMKPSGWADTAKSKGYIDGAELLDKGLPAPDASTKWSDPLIQNLRDEGYLGFKHGLAFTDWDMGAVPGMGLKKINTMGLDNPGIFGARNLFDSVGEGLKEGKESVLDALASPFLRESLSDSAPSAIKKFADSRGYTRYGGDNMPYMRPFAPNPQVAALLKRLGADKWWQDPALVQNKSVVRGAFYDPRIDEL